VVKALRNQNSPPIRIAQVNLKMQKTSAIRIQSGGFRVIIPPGFSSMSFSL
jgi:mRNA-degrading endonuclease RelE of RelBE toxin-antitoxin system